MKIKVKRAGLEWDDLLLQEQFKFLMYVDCLLRCDPNKDKFIPKIACI